MSWRVVCNFEQKDKSERDARSGRFARIARGARLANKLSGKLWAACEPNSERRARQTKLARTCCAVCSWQRHEAKRARYTCAGHRWERQRASGQTSFAWQAYLAVNFFAASAIIKFSKLRNTHAHRQTNEKFVCCWWSERKSKTVT